MNHEELKTKIDDHIDLIAFSAKGLAEAKDRATKFLIISGLLLNRQKELKVAIAQLQTLANAEYYTALSGAEGGTGKAAIQKAQAEANPKYAAAREALEEAQAEEKWVSGYLEIFSNAHVTYRQYSKD